MIGTSPAPVRRNLFEAAWFRAVGSFVPESVPKVLYEDSERAMFAMEYLPPENYKNWKDMLLRGDISIGSAAEIGSRLSLIHSRTARSDDLKRRFATDEIFHAIRIEPYLLATARAYPDLAKRLYCLAERTQAIKLALVHGDVSPKNILIGPTAPVFIDAECAWFGDPAFDLCFCLNHLLLKGMIAADRVGDLVGSFHALSRAYLCNVDWEDAEQFENRAADLLPALFLARVDGKSPVEYITNDAQRNRIRETARRFLADDSAKRLTALADAWRDVLENYWSTQR